MGNVGLHVGARNRYDNDEEARPPLPGDAHLGNVGIMVRLLRGVAEQPLFKKCRFMGIDYAVTSLRPCFRRMAIVSIRQGQPYIP